MITEGRVQHASSVAALPPPPQVQPGTVSDTLLSGRMYLIPSAPIPRSPLETKLSKVPEAAPLHQVDRSRSLPPLARIVTTQSPMLASSLQRSCPALRYARQQAGRQLPTFKQCVHGGLLPGWAEKRVGLPALSQPFRGGGPGPGELLAAGAAFSAAPDPGQGNSEQRAAQPGTAGGPLRPWGRQWP